MSRRVMTHIEIDGPAWEVTNHLEGYLTNESQPFNLKDTHACTSRNCALRKKGIDWITGWTTLCFWTHRHTYLASGCPCIYFFLKKRQYNFETFSRQWNLHSLSSLSGKVCTIKTLSLSINGTQFKLQGSNYNLRGSATTPVEHCQGSYVCVKI